MTITSDVAAIEAEVAGMLSVVAGAEVVGAAIEAGIQPAPEPVIIDAPTAEADAGPDDAPPPVEGSEPPAAKKRSVGLGAW